VNNELPHELKNSATSLSSIKNEYIPLNLLIEKILRRVEVLRKKYLIRGKTKYLTRKWKKLQAFVEGDEITVSLNENEKFTGIIKRISPTLLQLQSDDGKIHNIVSGEIIL
jgi:BirA family biotin operon repressor/biotin-[acetyl-CoA-carboxylase] ligase